MTDPILPPLGSVIELVRVAGRLILSHREAGARAERKEDGSPVTAADLGAHRLLVDGLHALTPGVPVLSEEGDTPPHAERRRWRSFWLVDPLDGTREFLAGRDDFTVNVALVVDGEPVLGVVYAPALGQLYFAEEGSGAWRSYAGGRRKRIYARRPPEAGLVVVESRSHRVPPPPSVPLARPVARRIRLGSSLKFCRVAEGRADVYVRGAPSMEWDVAAGDCIWRLAAEAGRNPSPLRYNKPDLRNDGFVLGAV